MKNLVNSMLLGVSLILFPYNASSQQIDCKRYKELIEIQESAYKHLVKGQNHLEQYIKDKIEIGVPFLEEELAEIKLIFPIQREIERRLLEELIRDFQKKCPCP